MKKLFYLLLALPLALISCETPDDGTTPGDVTFKLTSETTVNFAAEGGEGAITYTLEGAEENALPTATTEAEWITIETIAENIAFSVAANESEADRSGVIAVGFKGTNYNVTIKQAGVKAPEAITGWGIVGSMTHNWDLNSVIGMTLENGYYAIKNLELKASDVFMFVKDGSYAESFGGNGSPAEANHAYDTVVAGSSIRVKEAGSYDIYLNEELSMYYVMTEGTDPSEAIEPERPVQFAWNITVGEQQTKMVTYGRFIVARGVVLGDDKNFTLTNTKGVTYGAEGTFETNSEIKVFNGKTGINVNGVAGATYDVYFREKDGLVWVMDAGTEPKEEVIWTRVEGVHFYDHDIKNFGIFFISEYLTINVEIYSGVDPENSVIPEGIYYVGGDENDNGFYVDPDYSNMKINGVETLLYQGTMEVKHISGGYDITINFTSIHLNEVNIRYTGPIVGNPYMGRPVSNPE